MSLIHTDEGVQKHIDLMQAAINRMALNSSSCKTWCITIASGVLVVSIDKNQPLAVLFALMPTAAFVLLDCYYLSMERQLRKEYITFVTKLHTNAITVKDLYLIKMDVKWYSKPFSLLMALFSFSTWPLYCLLSGMLLGVYMFLTKNPWLKGVISQAL
ncbi:hypothetical protein GMPD_43250 [Geomonas paludis]|uniref:Uncharacterized protein n=1 Tax=Geomonas paludis TaxID=2740185 RepID=A0A6V8N1N1_9BACT|nr:hypothetical protein GMPD_43250 [Geomonas paludis]